jgi:hypothetical protein
MTPDTVTQLAILVLFVLPGIVYQTVRARFAGEAPQNRDTTNKILRALAASVVLVSVYLVLLGPRIVRALGGGSDQARVWIDNHPRQAGLLALALLFAAPALGALAAARRWHVGEWIADRRCTGPLGPSASLGRSKFGAFINRALAWLAAQTEGHRDLRYDPTPTAWDWAVDHVGIQQGFVRVLSKNGEWKGGAFGGSSYFTSYPERPAVFVQQAWQLDERGEFVAAQDASRGAWIPCDEALTVEFCAAGE